MNAVTFRQALRAGQPVFGTLAVSSSPRFVGMLAGLAPDFVFIDTEHVALDRDQVAWMCETYGRAGMAPVVRIPYPDPHLATMAIDAGAAGVIAPYIETVAQVQALRGAVRYRPIKGERLADALRDEQTLEPELRDYLAARNDGTSLILNIESVPALKRLEELLAVPGVDAVLIGPHDLSCSLGVPERYEDPSFDAAVRHILATARARGLGAGIHWWNGATRLAEWMQAGANLVIASGDISAAAADLAAQLQRLRGGISTAPAAI